MAKTTKRKEIARRMFSNNMMPLGEISKALKNYYAGLPEGEAEPLRWIAQDIDSVIPKLWECINAVLEEM